MKKDRLTSARFLASLGVVFSHLGPGAGLAIPLGLGSLR